jgi:hypothetical protein
VTASPTSLGTDDVDFSLDSTLNQDTKEMTDVIISS